MKTYITTHDGNGNYTDRELPQEFLASLPSGSPAGAPPPAPGIELVYDSAGSEPRPMRPNLPLRVSGYGQDASTSFRVESRGDANGTWQSLGPIAPNTVTMFDVGPNCETLRVVATNAFGSTEGPEYPVSH